MRRAPDQPDNYMSEASLIKKEMPTIELRSAASEPFATDAAVGSAAGHKLRDPAIDALRGFALLGIVVVNAPAFATPLNTFPAIDGWFDAASAWLVGTLGAGKFFLVFSLLFGFGMAELSKRALSGSGPRGSSASLRRRLAGLALIGAFHAVFLFVGDILMLYAALGVVVLALRSAPDRILLTVSAISFALGLATQTTIVTAAVVEASALTNATSGGGGYLGGFFEAVGARLTDLPAGIAFVLFFNGPVALSMMMLGVVWHRRGGMRVYRTLAPQLRRRLLLASIAGLALSALAAAVLVLGVTQGLAWPLVGAAAFVSGVSAPALSLGIVLVFLSAVDRGRNGLVIRSMTALGSASLTGYLLHSVLLSAVFLGWGLGFFGTMAAGAVFLTSLAVYLAMMALVGGWLSLFRMGPAEWLLRSIVERRRLRLV